MIYNKFKIIQIIAFKNIILKTWDNLKIFQRKGTEFLQQTQNFLSLYLGILMVKTFIFQTLINSA